MDGIRCPYCSHILGGDASLIGCKAQCNRCQQKFYIKAEDIISVSASIAPDPPTVDSMPEPPSAPSMPVRSTPAGFAAEQVAATGNREPLDVEHGPASQSDIVDEILSSDLSDEEAMAALEARGINVDDLTGDDDEAELLRAGTPNIDLDAVAPPGSRSGFNQTINYILLGISIAGALVFGTIAVVRFINRNALNEEIKAEEKAEFEKEKAQIEAQKAEKEEKAAPQTPADQSAEKPVDEF